MSLQDLLEDELVTRIASNRVHCNVCDKDMSSFGTYQHFERHWRECFVEEVDSRFRRMVIDYGEGFMQLEDNDEIFADDEFLYLEEKQVKRMRSWCPNCKRLLWAGEHFEGRACGTCHSVTRASDQGEMLERTLIWERVDKACHKSIIGRTPAYFTDSLHRFRRKLP